MADNLENYLSSYWVDKSGGVWKTVGVIESPAVVLEKLTHSAFASRPLRETHVIGSPNLADNFTELRPVSPND
jgi:hypothetical protein